MCVLYVLFVCCLFWFIVRCLCFVDVCRGLSVLIEVVGCSLFVAFCSLCVAWCLLFGFACCLLIDGCSTLVVFSWMFMLCRLCLLLVVCGSLFVVCCLLRVCWLLCVACWLLFGVLRCLLFVAWSSLFVVRCLLCVVGRCGCLFVVVGRFCCLELVASCSLFGCLLFVVACRALCNVCCLVFAVC